jgi:cysteine desulfurase / selenocysteine lyase
VLWGRKDVLAKMPPAAGGGEMIREVHQDRVSFREPPARFEAGTPNVGGAVALASAVDYLEGLGWDEIAAHERSLWERAMKRARESLGSGFTAYGPSEYRDRQGLVSFALRGTHPHDVAELLDADGVAVRAGHHCCQPLMDRLRVPALTRASPYLYNTPAEIDRLFDGLERVARLFAAPAPPARGSAAL